MKPAARKAKPHPPAREGKARPQLFSDTRAEDALSKVLSDRLSVMSNGVAQCVCQSQSFLDEIDKVADDVGQTQAFDITQAQLVQWRERIHELVTDARSAFAKVMNNPLDDEAHHESVKKILQTTHQLELSRKLQSSLLGNLQEGDPPPEEVQTIPRPPQRTEGLRQAQTRRAAPGKLRTGPRFSLPRSESFDDTEGEGNPHFMPELNTAGVHTAANSSGATQDVDAKRGDASTDSPHKTVPRIKSESALKSALPRSESYGLPTQGDAGNMTCTHMLSASVYLVLEAILVQVKAERAVLFKYIPARDELQAVACVGPGLPPLQQLRLPPRGASLVGSVFSSRTGANIINSHIARETLGFKCSGVCSLLALPIFREGQSIGAVLLLNKHRGCSPFSQADETDVFATAGLLTYLLTRYPVDFTLFDPLPFHSVVPLRPADLQSSGTQGSQETARRLVFRSQGNAKFLTKGALMDRAETSSQGTGLQDVAEYVSNLEECWDEAVRSLMRSEEACTQLRDNSSTLTEQLQVTRKTVKMLKDIAREHAQKNMQLAADVALLTKRVGELSDDDALAPIV